MTGPGIEQLRALAESWRSRANAIGAASRDATMSARLSAMGVRCGLLEAAIELDALVLAVERGADPYARERSRS